MKPTSKSLSLAEEEVIAGNTRLTLQQVAQTLRQGKAVIVPTDTVWGLALLPNQAQSPSLLWKLKGRDPEKPIAWLVGSKDDLCRFGESISDEAVALAEAFWPGSLTLVVKASNLVPQAFRAADQTIALRWANCNALQELLETLGFPLAVTSANHSGAQAPRRLEDIDVRLIQCCGGFWAPSAYNLTLSGVASTVVDCAHGSWSILREGLIDEVSLKEALDKHSA